MLKKYFAKQAAKKGASWMAKTEAKILYTAVATLATHKLLQAASAKIPALKFLEPKKVS
jgi:hypothetical protein